MQLNERFLPGYLRDSPDWPAIKAAIDDGLTVAPDGEMFVSNHMTIDVLLRTFNQPPVADIIARFGRNEPHSNIARTSETKTEFILLLVFINHPRPEDNGYTLVVWPKVMFTREQAEERCAKKLREIDMEPAPAMFPVKG